MPSRLVSDLSPAFRAGVEVAQSGWKKAGLDILVVCTLRDAVEQEMLYAIGRTVPGKIVTWARPWESKHQTGEALDVVPLVGGKPLWSTSGDDMKVWQLVGAIGERAGLDWAGRWPTRVREYGHFQIRKKQ